MKSDPAAPYFDLAETVELTIPAGTHLGRRWARPESFYWLLTLEGAASFAESGRSRFLHRGTILARPGPLGALIRPGKRGAAWRVLSFTAEHPFPSGRMAYVARQMGSLHSVPMDSPCVALARQLVNGTALTRWERYALAFRWFHAWWQEADRHNREVVRNLGTPPDATNPSHHIASLKSLADQLGYSPGYLSRILGQRWHESPARSLRKARLEFAAGQLRETAIQVGALAHELGYLSECAFVRAFRLHHGQPPEKYRKARAGVPDDRS